MAKLVSPNELHKAACKEYLDGREPETKEEWELCVNYWAFNIADGLKVSATIIMSKILDCPLSLEEVTQIAMFQEEKK